MRTRWLFPILVWLVACVLDARAVAHSAESNVIAVDTRSLTMTQLTVAGPASIPSGSQGSYTATLSYQGAPAQDVTAQCQWSVAGGPKVTGIFEIPAMWGNILEARVASAIPLQVTASIERDTGRIVSAPFAVTIAESNDLNMGITFRDPSRSGPVYVRPAGSNFTWRMAAEADGLAVSQAGVTFQWFLDGQPLATGKGFDLEIPGAPGTRELKVIATASPGRTGTQYKTLTFDAPPVVNEPPRLIPAVDPYFGAVLMEDETVPDNAIHGTVPFQFNPLKIQNGLIVLTHGIYAKGSDEWLWKMARAIRKRLDLEHKPLPNIAIFDWGQLSNPTEYWGIESLKEKAVEISLKSRLGAPILASAVALDFMADLWLVRLHGQSEGEELADWIRTEWIKDNISLSRPVHLIGHSAGGFVVGECGWQLRNIAGDIRVTMLDTPVPILNHVWRYPGVGRLLDRYVSSAFGATELPTTWLVGLGGGSDNGYTTIYKLSDPPAGPEIPYPPSHSYAHDWYAGTVVSGVPGTAGFGWSQFLAPPPPAPFATLEGSLSTPPPPPTETTVPITGFTTFGAVTPDARGFVLAEGTAQKAGVMRAAYSFPPGTHSLRFAYRFTTPGDGDFLSVSFGDFPPIFAGKDMPLTRDGELTVDVPVEHLAEAQGDLVFRLVSRGQANAVVTVHDIVAVTVEDADNDGLSNAAELAQGTSAMIADTDGDGLSDAAEVNIYLTNPLRADTDGDGQPDGAEVAAQTDPKNPLSRLAITGASFPPTGFALQFTAQPVRNYRVLRSPTPGFERYSVLGLVLSNAAPTQSFLDTTLLPGQAGKMFYRVELVP